jgi:hypothetical protein
VNPLVAIAIIAVAVAVAVTVMLLVRRFVAPAGGFFTDSDRAAGVFGVTGTSFAVLLAFVIFLAFSSYDRARDEASREAVAISQLYRTAKLFSSDTQRRLDGELICYARAVVHDEWNTMRDERASASVSGWLTRIEGTVDEIRLEGGRQLVAYDHWFDQMADRREGRRGRLGAAEPLVPALVWLALILGGALVVAYMCFYADPAESPVVQGLMTGAVTAIVVAGMLVVWFLDHPYENESGSIKPSAMTMTLEAMEAESSASGTGPGRLCDERGQS